MPRIRSGAANPAPKLVTLIAAMCAGADCIDDADIVGGGGMNTLFGGVYALSTIGTLLREFTFGHARQMESVPREHLVGLGARVDLPPGADVRAFVDIDSLLRPVYGHAKQGVSYGHTKIAGKQVLRKGLSPLATTISTDTAAPMIAGLRLRAGRTGSGKGCGTHGRPSHRDRPRRGRHRADPGPRRLRLRQPRRGERRPPSRGPKSSRPVLLGPPKSVPTRRGAVASYLSSDLRAASAAVSKSAVPAAYRQTRGC